MPKVSEMKNSRFLTQFDVGQEGKVLTIESIDHQNVAPENRPKELKWVLHFEEEEFKPLALNRKNTELIARILNSDDTDEWIGKQIVAYQDPTIDFGGKITGGIRVRAVKPSDKGGSAAGSSAKSEEPAPKASPADAITSDTYGDLKVHVGKCKGQALRDLTPEQVTGLVTHWLPAAKANSRPTADDQRLMKALELATSKTNDDNVPY